MRKFRNGMKKNGDTVTVTMDKESGIVRGFRLHADELTPVVSMGVDMEFSYTADDGTKLTRLFENGAGFYVSDDDLNDAFSFEIQGMEEMGQIDPEFIDGGYTVYFTKIRQSSLNVDDGFDQWQSYISDPVMMVYGEVRIISERTHDDILRNITLELPCRYQSNPSLRFAKWTEEVNYGDPRFQGWENLSKSSVRKTNRIRKSTTPIVFEHNNRMKKADFTTVKILEDSGIVTDYRIMENEYYPTFSVDVMYTYVTDEGEELTRLFKNGGTIITDFYDFNDALDASLASGVMYDNGESVVPVDFEVTRAYISEIRGYWIEGLDRVPSGTDAIDCDVFIEADLRLVDSDEKEYAVSDTLVMYNPIFKPEVELRYALIMEETIRMSDPRFQGWENLSKSSVRKTNRIRKSTTPIVFEHNNRMFGLDIDFDIGDDDGPWEAIGRFDDIHGTDFWDRITEDMLIPSYIDVKDITYVNTWDDVLSFSDELEKNPMRKSSAAIHAKHNGRTIPLVGTVSELVKIMGRK